MFRGDGWGTDSSRHNFVSLLSALCAQTSCLENTDVCALGSSFNRQELLRDFYSVPFTYGSPEPHTYFCPECCSLPPCLLAPCLTLCCLPAPTFSLLPTASFKDLWVGGEGLVGTSLPFAMDEVGNCPETPEGAHWHYPCSTALLSGHQWTSPFSATPNFLLLQLL